MYVCCIENGQVVERHLALALFGGGSEALCGQRVAEGRRADWRKAIEMTNCTSCRSVAVSFRPSVLRGVAPIR